MGVSLPLAPLPEYPLSRGAGAAGAGFLPAGRLAGGAGGVGFPRVALTGAPLQAHGGVHEEQLVVLEEVLVWVGIPVGRLKEPTQMRRNLDA